MRMVKSMEVEIEILQTKNLQFCVPMMPNHFHIVPLIDEMIYIFLENPSDNSAPRYYMGSQINSQFKLKVSTIC